MIAQPGEEVTFKQIIQHSISQTAVDPIITVNLPLTFVERNIGFMYREEYERNNNNRKEPKTDREKSDSVATDIRYFMIHEMDIRWNDQSVPSG